MSVVKPEMITREITRKDLLPISFLKMSPYTGSKRGLRYKLKRCAAAEPAGGLSAGKVSASGGKDAAHEGGSVQQVPDGLGTPPVDVLRCWAWAGRMAFDFTPAEEMSVRDFEFSDAGIDAAIGWLNERLDEADGRSGGMDRGC